MCDHVLDIRSHDFGLSSVHLTSAGHLTFCGASCLKIATYEREGVSGPQSVSKNFLLVAKTKGSLPHSDVCLHPSAM